ncbi:cilia- and flagella-associated protein 299-like isoform X1 [Nilaparvata lugens]|uniref:cilia- and flagella-associated protein 299-like isoform X2 n=1 Tax=Nilaparvata lugens TaxID=108931 RepID=UPI000B989ADC|nr:cilia- and flagella-associated protein 299-like isoform X2 [Nilaparvata lugens]XP_039292340.1 cilia- and flagella-associated protein 299-like isoform X1 [Nilaparvata lugens]
MVFGGSPQVEADRYLIPFPTYDDYLDSLVTPIDLFYGRSIFIARCVAQLGYRARGQVLTREEFAGRAAAARALDNPPRQDQVTTSSLLPLTQLSVNVEPLLLALSQREVANRRSIVNTIIYLCVKKRTGEYVSAYIDFNQRLRQESWNAFFQEGKPLRPKTSDLCYYNWHTNFTSSTDSDNFKVKCDQERGLLFNCIWDGKMICVNPNLKSPGPSTTRTRIYSPNYAILDIYDHKLRRSY